jgi:TPR repeat protein
MNELRPVSTKLYVLPIVLLLVTGCRAPAAPTTRVTDSGRLPTAAQQQRAMYSGMYFGAVKSISADTLVIVIDPRLAWSHGPKPGSLLHFKIGPNVTFESAIFGPNAPAKGSDLLVGDEVTVRYVVQGTQMVAREIFLTARRDDHAIASSAACVPGSNSLPRHYAANPVPLLDEVQAPPQWGKAHQETEIESRQAEVRRQEREAPQQPGSMRSLGRYAAADKRLREDEQYWSNYYSGTQWIELWNKAKQAHQAELSAPAPEPSDPAARAEFIKGVQVYETGDPTDAAQWFAKCAQRGDPYCETELGLQYETGKGVPEDLRKAASLYVAAAQAGNSRAQNNIGNLYVQGLGVPKNYQEAVRWYAASAKQGNPDGLYSLARMYEFGFGVPLNRAAAVNLYRAAALRGNLDAVEAAHWLSDPTNLSFPDEASRDAYLAQLQAADAQWHGCEADVWNQRRLGFRAPDCMRQWVNPNTW